MDSLAEEEGEGGLIESARTLERWLVGDVACVEMKRLEAVDVTTE